MSTQHVEHPLDRALGCANRLAALSDFYTEAVRSKDRNLDDASLETLGWMLQSECRELKKALDSL
jgi:hypothetical protein